MKKILNKWQVHFHMGRRMDYVEAGWYAFSFGVIKLLSLPKEGLAITKRNYKGFLIKFYFWLPIYF